MKPTEPNNGVAGEATEQEIPFSRRVYFLQHQLIPQWVFTSNGDFYKELTAGNISNFILKSAEVVGQHYANEITVKPIEDKNAVLISFPLPEALANCFFVMVKKNKDHFSYFTYEKTFNLSDGSESFYGVVGGWDKAGSRSNYGPRVYKTAQEFIGDVLH